MKKLNTVLDIAINVIMYVFLGFAVITVCMLLKRNWLWSLFMGAYCGLTTDFMKKIQSIVCKKWITYIILALSQALILILALLIGMPTGEFIPYKV